MNTRLFVVVLLLPLAIQYCRSQATDGCRDLGVPITYERLPFDGRSLNSAVTLLGRAHRNHQTIQRSIRFRQSQLGAISRGTAFGYELDSDSTEEPIFDFVTASSNTVRAPSNPEVIYKQLPDGMLTRSDDGGTTWKSLRMVISGRSLKDFINTVSRDTPVRATFTIASIHPSDPMIVFSTLLLQPYERGTYIDRETALQGMWESKDGGESWTSFNRDITGRDFVLRKSASLALSTSNPSTMYAFMDGDIAVSKNSGTTWKMLELKGFLRNYPPNNFSAGLADNSSAAHPEFRRKSRRILYDNLPVYRLIQIIVDPASEDSIYVVSEKGILRSLDGGHTWVLLNPGFDEIDGINSLVIDSGDSSHLFVGSRRGLFLTRDRGCRFQLLSLRTSPENNKEANR